MYDEYEESNDDNFEYEEGTVVESDIQNKINRMQEQFAYIYSQLDIRNVRVNFVTDFGNVKDSIKYTDFVKLVDDYYLRGQHKVLVDNYKKLYHDFPLKVDELKYNIDVVFRDLIDISNSIYTEKEAYKQDNSALRTELITKDKEIEFLKSELDKQEKAHIRQMLNRNNEMVEQVIVAMKELKPDFEVKTSESYFDDKVSDNIAKENNIESDNEVEQEDVESAEEIRLRNIQDAHTEVLQHLSDMELTPIHKVNPMSAKLYYNEAWDRICPKYDLQPLDRPKIISDIEEYFDKDDDYFDNINLIG